jgi:hypothetical protein
VTWGAIRVPVMPARARPVSPGAVRGCGVAVRLASRPGGPPAGCWSRGAGQAGIRVLDQPNSEREPDVRQTSARPGCSARPPAAAV